MESEILLKYPKTKQNKQTNKQTKTKKTSLKEHLVIKSSFALWITFANYLFDIWQQIGKKYMQLAF